MKKNSLDYLSHFFKYVLLTIALLYIAVYLVLVYFRIQYPFELHWQEGSLVEHVVRVLSEKPLYDHPSLEFITYLYTPLFFYISAGVSLITGVGFLPLRIIALIASLGCFLFIFLIVKKETGDNFAGIIASSLFAATYKISGSWFDIGRMDLLFILFILAGLYLIKFYSSTKSYIFAGILFSLSFLTKQTALVISMPIVLCSIFLDRRPAIFLIGTMIVLVGGSTLLLNYVYDGWYYYYVFELPRTTPFSTSQFAAFWPYDIKRPLAIGFTISIFFLLSQLIVSNKKNFIFYFSLAAGMLGGSWLNRLHLGSNENVLIPAFVAISILFGLGLYKFIEFIQAVPEERRALLKIFIYIICILQFTSGSVRYNPFDQVPTEKDLEAGREFINTMEEIKGEVFVPSSGYLPAMAGKSNYAHKGAIRDVLRSAVKKEAKEKLFNEIKQAVHEKRFGAIIVDSLESWHPPDIEKYYTKLKPVFNDKNVFFPVVGMQTRPEFIYVPKKQ